MLAHSLRPNGLCLLRVCSLSVQVLQDLALPHFHHELVKAAVELSFEHPDKAQQFAGLLKHLSETGVITSTQMAQVSRQKRGAVERVGSSEHV